MNKEREMFMENAGSILFELEEVSKNEKEEIFGAPANTESTPFLSIFFCYGKEEQDVK